MLGRTLDVYEQGESARVAALDAAVRGFEAGESLGTLLRGAGEAHARGLREEEARRGIAVGLLTWAAILLDGAVTVAWAGEIVPRVVRGGETRPLGEPHTLATKYRKDRGPRGVDLRAMLTTGFGATPGEWETRPVSVEPGDRLLLRTVNLDGLGSQTWGRDAFALIRDVHGSALEDAGVAVLDL